METRSCLLFMLLEKLTEFVNVSHITYNKKLKKVVFFFLKNNNLFKQKLLTKVVNW
jgi:hypothetical protein